MSPDPCDARETEPGPGFVLPCRCGGHDRAERYLLQLAIAHGRSMEAERAAQEPALHPRQPSPLTAP